MLAQLITKQGLRENIIGGLIFFDFEKAFDHLDRHYLIKVLRRLRINSFFIRDIATLLEDTQAIILYNGLTTDMISIQSGIRQGCPISPLLFALATEPL